MNEDQQNFDSLRRLLALKRHEMPPPGYFNSFSREVIAQIRAGQIDSSANLLDRIPWLMRWLGSLESKPVFAGGFATGLCLLLIFGAVIAQRPESAPQPFLQPTARETEAPPMVAAVAVPMTPAGFERSPGQITIDNSTNPVINFQSGSFSSEPMPINAQFANFQISPGN